MELDKLRNKVMRISQTGETKEYSSIADAARDNSTNVGDIVNACKGKLKKVVAINGNI